MAGLDASTAATIAALVVAILAMLVAITQAIQQYILTGQLIRLCDSVVYGKMPGHGRRVWQMSQLGFRVLYRIPQVSLRKELWPGKLPHIPSYAKGLQAVPDLGLLGIGDSKEDDIYEKFSSPWRAGRSSISFAAGEASWVSFCRAVQPSSRRSMVLDLIQADADRCPPDLPNVTIQMSMRDIAVMGLMAGMKCTQASFKSKTISMQGLAGTITTSQHPLLGPLLHFSPRDLSVNDIKDLQLGNGTVSPSWMARMWDEVTVAGHRYTRHERMQMERDEAVWAKRTRERAMVPINRRKCSPPPTSLYGLRRRSSVASTTAVSSQSSNHHMVPDRSTQAASSSCRQCQTLWTRSDGEWYVDNGVPNDNQAQRPSSQRLGNKAKSTDAILEDISGGKRIIEARLWTEMVRKKKRFRPSATADQFETEVETGNLAPKAIKRPVARPGQFQALNWSFPYDQSGSDLHMLDKGAALQPRWFIKDYINQKREMLHDKDMPENAPRDGPLLIGWYDDDGQEVPELNEPKENLAKMVVEVWARSETDSRHKRAAFYARKWRSIVRQRQLDRERRKQHRPLSYSISFRSRSPGSQYKSLDSTRSRRTFGSEDRWSQAPASASLYSRPNGYYSPRVQHHTRQPMMSANNNANIHSGESSSDSRLTGQARQSQTRSRSHVRSRPLASRYVEYGKTVVSGNSGIGTSSRVEASEDPRSLISSRSPLYTRVEFGPEIHFHESSSGSDENSSEIERLSSAGKARISSRKEPSANRPDPIERTKGILKSPKARFPEEPNPVRERVDPLRNTGVKGIPSGAQWTKIDRRLVSPAALKAKREKFEEDRDLIIVLRVLQKEEIQEYAAKTEELRSQFMQRSSRFTQLIRYIEARREELGISSGRPLSQSRAEKPRGRRRRRDGSLSPEPSQSFSVPRTNNGSDSRETTPQRFETFTPLRSDSDHGESGIRSHSPPIIRPSVNRRYQNDPSTTDYAPERGSRNPSRRQEISFRPYNDYYDSEISEPEIEVPESIFGSNPYGTYPRRHQSMGRDFWNGSDDNSEIEGDLSLLTKRGSTSITGRMSWFWVCQIDVIPGYMATPLASQFSTEFCVGAITVILEAVGMLSHYSQPVYFDSPCHPRGLDWMRSNLSTFPPYGVSANHHHGTVISGGYNTTFFPGFRAPLFQIELLSHYGFQVDRHQPSDAGSLRARLTELMALDSWLSFCGRQPEICGHGPASDPGIVVAGVGDLLYTMPKLIERTMESFEFEFTNLERSANDGGQQIIQQIAGNLLDTLGWKVEGLSPAERLFALVAMLRASKMALCITQGSDTSSLRDILLNDVQVHLV